MAPPNKNVKAFKETVLLAYTLHNAIVIGNKEYVPEPPNFEEKFRIYKFQVLIPFTIFKKTHTLMGPTLDPAEGLVRSMNLFHAYHRTKPIVSVKETMSLEYQTTPYEFFV